MLTVLDIQNKEFKRNKLGGYNIEEVDRFLGDIVETHQDLMRKQEALKDTIKELQKNVEYYREMESTIQNVLIMADKTAKEVTEGAVQEAQEIKEKAQKEAEKMTQLAKERSIAIVSESKESARQLCDKMTEAETQYMGYKVQLEELLQAQLEFFKNQQPHLNLTQETMDLCFSQLQQDIEENAMSPAQDLIQQEDNDLDNNEDQEAIIE